MPNYRPPASYDGRPRTQPLLSRTRLTRIHSASFRVTAFNPTPAPVDEIGGGRFDATSEDSYAYLYAGVDDAVAVSETLLRDIPFDDRGARFLPRSQISGRLFGWLRPTVDLTLVALRTGEDLAAVGQDSWLVGCPAREYPNTRRWAHAIRRWAPTAQGFVWRSRLEPGGLAYVFFQERCPPDVFEEDLAAKPLGPTDRALDSGLGTEYLREILVRYRVTIWP